MEADRAVVAMWKCLITLCVCVGRGAVAMVWRLTVLLLLCGSVLLYPRREAGILWIHHRRCPRPQRFLVSDLHSIFLSGFLSYLADGLIW